MWTVHRGLVSVNIQRERGDERREKKEKEREGKEREKNLCLIMDNYLDVLGNPQDSVGFGEDMPH